MTIIEQLLADYRQTCMKFPDFRKGECRYSMADAGLSALALFFMQSESFLSHQRSLAEGGKKSNCATLFGMEKIPTDNCIRMLLDPVMPSYLQPCFDKVLSVFEDNRRLDSLKVLGGRCLVALDGTEYFTSRKIHCDCCLTRKRKNGDIDYYHSMLAATIVAPGHNHVLPLMPEFITPQNTKNATDSEGSEAAKTQVLTKQDCERKAAKRWLVKQGENLKKLRPIYLGDDLFACQPISQCVRDVSGDFIFTCKPKSHKTLYNFVTKSTAKTLEINGGKGRKFSYQWMENVPLRAGSDAMRVNWFSLTITNKKTGKSTTKSFVTSLPVSKKNIIELVDCARARWKIENETFNVLKNNGYHLEHNFGHGKDYLAMLFVTINLLAFGYHTICDKMDRMWQQARQKKGSRKRFFEHLRTITTYLVLPSWFFLCNTLITGKPPP